MFKQKLSGEGPLKNQKKPSTLARRLPLFSVIILLALFGFTFGTGAAALPIHNNITSLQPHSTTANATTPQVTPRYYYFPYFDSISTGNADWLLIWNPTGVTTTVTVSIAGAVSGNGYKSTSIGPQNTALLQFPNLSAGPVVVTSPGGTSLIVSQRTLTNGTFEEVNAIPDTNLDSDYYYTWYDSVTMATHVYIANPNSQPVAVDITLHGTSLTGANPIIIGANSVGAKSWPQQLDGPLELKSHVPGNTGSPLPIITSERAIYNGGFNEIAAFSASHLSNDYSWTWYDSNITGGADWLLLSNPSTVTTITVSIDIGSGAYKYNVNVGPNSSVFPSYAHITNGPVHVHATGNFLASQRTITSGQFEEVLGTPASGMSTDSYFSWFNSIITNNATWLLVANPNTTTVNVSIQIASNVVSGTLSISGAPPPSTGYGEFSVPAGRYGFMQVPGTQTGYVYIHATLPVLVSQRTLQGSQFNETVAQTGAPQQPVQIFPANNPWNTDISGLPVDNAYTAFLNSSNLAHGLHPDFGTTYLGEPNGIPYMFVNGNQAFVPLTFDQGGGAPPPESDAGPYPIPGNAPIEGGSNSSGDRHVIVVDTNNNRLYETWLSYPVYNSNGTINHWSVGSAAIFNLQSNALRPDGCTSADAAGLPIYPGLVKYDEVASGIVNHAFRFTLNHSQQGYIHPATHQAGASNAAYPPMGLRVRLKNSFVIPPNMPTEDKVIVTALKKYGMLLADNGSDWYLSGAPDPRWNDSNLSVLQQDVHGSDFEAVNTGPILTQSCP